MKRQYTVDGRKAFVTLCAVCALMATAMAPAGATGAVSAGMAGAEVAMPAEGIPLNPAAAGTISNDAVYIGAGLPLNQGLPLFVSIHQPAETFGATLYGTLGAALTRAPAADGASFVRTESVVYQIADPYKAGVAGLGLRWLRRTDEGTGATGETWRLDLGWQQTLAPGLIGGVLVSDVAGNDLVLSDGSSAARATTWRAGLAYRLGSIWLLTADVWDFTRYVPHSVATGLVVQALPQLSLRAGYRHAGGLDDYTAGAGWAMGGWQLDLGAKLGAQIQGMLSLAVHF